MKQLTLYFILISFLSSCTYEQLSAPQTRQLIREQITAHYESLQVEGYSPLSNSEIDTIAVHHNQHGELTGIVEEFTHRFRAMHGDSLTEQSQVFEVQVYEDDVVVKPAKPMTGPAIVL